MLVLKGQPLMVKFHKVLMKIQFLKKVRGFKISILTNDEFIEDRLPLHKMSSRSVDSMMPEFEVSFFDRNCTCDFKLFISSLCRDINCMTCSGLYSSDAGSNVFDAESTC